jgi:hypothetical protein
MCLRPRRSVALVFLFVISLLGSFNSRASDALPRVNPEKERIVFLRLRRDTNGVTLLKATVHDGHLKTAFARGPLEFEVARSDGVILQTGALKDPTITRLEFEDPEHPGEIRVREIKRDSAEFMLRVRFEAAASILRFYKSAESMPGKLGAKADRQLIGEIPLSKVAEQ